MAPITVRPMHQLKQLTLQYDQHEDRILVVINAGTAEQWCCWLTRRMILDILGRAESFLQKTSPTLSKTPLEYRGDYSVMEREVALARTQKSLSKTPTSVVTQAAGSAELATELSITARDKDFEITFRGREGGSAQGSLARPELQRVLHMIEQEAGRVGWREGAGATVVSPVDPVAAAAKKRRAN